MISFMKMLFKYLGWMGVSVIPLIIITVSSGKEPNPMDLFILGFIFMWVGEKAKEKVKG